MFSVSRHSRRTLAGRAIVPDAVIHVRYSSPYRIAVALANKRCPTRWPAIYRYGLASFCGLRMANGFLRLTRDSQSLDALGACPDRLPFVTTVVSGSHTAIDFGQRQTCLGFSG